MLTVRNAFLFLASLCALCTGVMSQDEPGAKWIPSQHHNTGRSGHTPKYIIIHGTAGGSSAEGVAAWFQNPASQVSSHYIIGQDGTVVQCVREANTAWANGRIEAGADPWWTVNPNLVTISIEHVKAATDNSNELTAVQRAASYRLVKNIIARYPGIKKGWADSNSGITGHFSISPQSRERCPGPFPWDGLFQHLIGDGGNADCIGTVTADALNIRSQPNTGGAIVGSLRQGTAVQLLSRTTGENVGGNPGWFNIGNGFVSGYYLRLHEPKPSWCY